MKLQLKDVTSCRCESSRCIFVAARPQAIHIRELLGTMLKPQKSSRRSSSSLQRQIARPNRLRSAIGRRKRCIDFGQPSLQMYSRKASLSHPFQSSILRAVSLSVLCSRRCRSRSNSFGLPLFKNVS